VVISLLFLSSRKVVSPPPRQSYFASIGLEWYWWHRWWYPGGRLSRTVAREQTVCGGDFSCSTAVWPVTDAADSGSP